MESVRVALSSLASVALLVAVASGQSESIASFRISVADKSGVFKNIAENDLVVQIDGKLVTPITIAPRAQYSTDICLVVDFSDSMDFKSGRAFGNDLFARAFGEKVASANSGNRYCLVTFSDSISVDSTMPSDHARIEKAVTSLKNRQPLGGTKVFDAINAGLEQLSNGVNKRKVLVLVSDMIDGLSDLSLSDVEMLAHKRDVTLYLVNLTAASSAAIKLMPTLRERTPERILVGYSALVSESSPLNPVGVGARPTFRRQELDLPAHTGGRIVFPMTEPEIRASFELILEELDNQLEVAFKIPSTGERKLRKLTVKLRRDSNAAKNKLTVTSRRRIYL